MRIAARTRFQASLTATVLGFTLASLAQPGTTHFPRPPHHDMVKALDKKGMPRSTVDVGLPATTAGKIAGSCASEIDRLEHDAINQLRSAAQREPRQSSRPGSQRLGPWQGHEHGSPISFSYRSPQAGQTSHASASTARRR